MYHCSSLELDFTCIYVFYNFRAVICIDISFIMAYCSRFRVTLSTLEIQIFASSYNQLRAPQKPEGKRNVLNVLYNYRFERFQLLPCHCSYMLAEQVQTRGELFNKKYKKGIYSIWFQYISNVFQYL